VRLRVLSLGLGAFAWAESHPFTIQSVARAAGDAEGLVLTVKQAGNWTRKLYALANAASYDAEKTGAGREVRVLVEGPYGGPGHTMYAGFDAALFVAGGSGITYALGCARDVIQKAADGRARTKVVELVWVVREPCTCPCVSRRKKNDD
jgi:ferric-chelate reductase